MKGFHLCVRLVAGGGIRDTQVPLLDSSLLVAVYALIFVKRETCFSNCTHHSSFFV